MNQPLHFALVGGDLRQRWLARLLAEDGHTVTTLALSDAPTDLTALEQVSCVVLPLPLTGGDGLLFTPLSPEQLTLTAALDALTPGQYIFAGRVTPQARSLAAERGLSLRDYFLREELTIANAVPTAEGAVQLAMEGLPTTIHRSRVLVTGFGRVGQCCAGRFAALGARVTVCARNPAQLALAESLGYDTLPLSRLSACPPQDLVVNTVPAPLFGVEELRPLGTPLLLELASAPGGFDKSAAQQLGLVLIPASGLPGKVAPATAARAIRTALYAMLEEHPL